jgi:hypothetical protein
MSTDAEVIAAIDASFGAVGKPDHFTNYQHCEECAEHDETLRSHDRDTLRLEHVNNPGWDPLCFCSVEGKAYYMPTLVRFALAPPTEGYHWYGDQLLFHLAGSDEDNAFYEYCNAAQRQAVCQLLAHFVEARSIQVERSLSADELLRTHERWSAKM